MIFPCFTLTLYFPQQSYDSCPIQNLKKKQTLALFGDLGFVTPFLR